MSQRPPWSLLCTPADPPGCPLRGCPSSQTLRGERPSGPKREARWLPSPAVMLSPSAITTFTSWGRSSYTVLAGCGSGGRAGQLNFTPWVVSNPTSAVKKAHTESRERGIFAKIEGVAGIIFTHAYIQYTYSSPSPFNRPAQNFWSTVKYVANIVCGTNECWRSEMLSGQTDTHTGQLL